ncbi:hypothetical protein [Cyclobacterium sp. SYSU L10401]|uniref:hypothetical protein n=1 Tax=Cyclobacterium sp. SYSU L10401 TaxID=2678657 RepID=UPI0013CFE741|nr:hypothetical protein [Cyclobacterium sp. SYSU L10401]
MKTARKRPSYNPIYLQAKKATVQGLASGFDAKYEMINFDWHRIGGESGFHKLLALCKFSFRKTEKRFKMPYLSFLEPL